ncbi:uncharacterized protein PAC_03292 [Phialocephala subalpina]|uniref:Uncharacterized protein n=1 Tax=Phialocephala subalpina TaxID=576137 RepID=A0A1L7WKV5_9HELO|nr:uncharacterized protein PAC_03292 [Phialocephala subalpina]
MKSIQNLLALLLLSFPLPTLQSTPQYAIFFDPGVPITLVLHTSHPSLLPSPEVDTSKTRLQFQSTLIIPGASPNPSPNNIQAVWPGLQPASDSFVFQTVVESASGGPDTWWIEPQVYCAPQILYGERNQLFPGDSLKSIFQLQPDGQMALWWYNTPGWQGNPPSDTTFSGSAIMNPQTYPNGGPLTKAVLSIEIQGTAGVWDFGNVLFGEVVVTAQTTDMSWCEP